MSQVGKISGNNTVRQNSAINSADQTEKNRQNDISFSNKIANQTQREAPGGRNSLIPLMEQQQKDTAQADQDLPEGLNTKRIGHTINLIGQLIRGSRGRYRSPKPSKKPSLGV